MTTKQYVRCRLCKSQEGRRIGYVDHVRTRANPLRVDDVLLMYTRWTNLGPFRESSDSKIYRGPWAGHAFDIVAQQEVDVTGDHWEDLTDDIVTEAARLRNALKKRPGRHDLSGY